MMLQVRRTDTQEGSPWIEVLPDQVLPSLTEDTNYLFSVGRIDARVFVDDVELSRDATSFFRWRPSFYAGRVVAEVVLPGETKHRYLLDISPSPSKSGQDNFDEMVEDIRTFDQTLLSGYSSATMAFGPEGRTSKYESDILLARLREYGPSFLGAVEAIARSPHRFLAADTKVLPLSRVRQLHHRSLQDRRLAAIATGHTLGSESIDSFQVNSLTSAPTFDTSANRTLLALLLRFRAAVSSVQGKVGDLKLGTPQDEQSVRVERRLQDLALLTQRTRRLLFTPLFREVTNAATSAAGFTQIAAQPTYSKAYRLGCRAVATQLEGSGATDQLHVPPSWGIYEIWCLLSVATSIAEVTGAAPVEAASKTVAAERALWFTLPGGRQLEVLFQATFPALRPSGKRFGWSLSRERRPDIVLVLHGINKPRALVLDAKWRSGRDNVLEAMESAHNYHDALRVNSARPSPCLLLLPGQASVPELEQDEYIQEHGVGAVSSVCVAGSGRTRIKELLKGWLNGS